MRLAGRVAVVMILAKGAVDAGPADFEAASYLGRTDALSLEALDGFDVDSGRGPLVDAPGLGLGDPLHLPLPAQRRFELAEDTQHVEERPA